jgi:hypothetical protein
MAPGVGALPQCVAKPPERGRADRRERKLAIDGCPAREVFADVLNRDQQLSRSLAKYVS